MSDKSDGTIVKMLRWIDSGVARLIERVSRTEQQTWTTQVSLDKLIEALDRIEAKLQEIERRLPPPPSE